MNPTEIGIWQRLVLHDFESPSARDLVRTLAVERAWSDAYARRVVEEYRRFLLIATSSLETVSPSHAVDLAWHTHVLDTREYFERFCPEVLGRVLHHVPARDDLTSRSSLEGAYLRTLVRYRALFGAPPSDIWPASPRDAVASAPLQIRPPRLEVIGLVLLSLLVGWAGGLFELPGRSFLVFYVAALLSVFPIVFVLDGILEDAYVRPSGADLPRDPNALALLAGGSPRVTDAALARLAQRDAIIVVENHVLARDGATGHDPVEAMILNYAKTKARPSELDVVVERALDGAWRELEGRGLVFPRAAASRIAWMGATPALVVLALGVVKLGVGISRARPVCFLALLLCAALGLVLRTARARRVTWRGRALLEARRAELTSIVGPVDANTEVASSPCSDSRRPP